MKSLAIISQIDTQIQADDKDLKLISKIKNSIAINIHSTPEDREGNLQNFKAQEIAKYNHLLDTIQKSCNELERALQGNIMFSNEIDLLFKSILRNQVPIMWSKVSYFSEKSLASWLKDLNERIEFFKIWNLRGDMRAYLISAFFFPQGFITSIKQLYSRQKMIPFDTVNLKMEVHNNQEEPLTLYDGFNINGIFLEGAKINQDTLLLDDSDINQTIQKINFIRYFQNVSLKPIQNLDQNSNFYQCPLYRTQSRTGTIGSNGVSTNFIFYINLNTDKDPNVWIRKGVALICQINN